MFGVPVTGITDARVTYWLAIDLARCLPWGNATRKGLGWARVVGDVNMSVRRGAWYEVTRLTHEAATLDVHHETRSVPRSTVEIVTSRPRRWSLVERPYDAVDLPMSWGARYGVCPHCSHRAPVARGFTQMPCPRCGEVSTIPV